MSVAGVRPLIYWFIAVRGRGRDLPTPLPVTEMRFLLKASNPIGGRGPRW